MRYDKSTIITALHGCGVVFKDKGRNIEMECMFHPEMLGRSDGSKDSLALLYDGSKAHCWSCGWRGSWRGIAASLGIDVGKPTYDTSDVEFDFNDIDEQRRRKIEGDSGIEAVPNDVTVWSGDWRGLPSAFLEPIAYSWYDSGYRVDRILFPDYQHDGVIWVAGAAHDEDREQLGNQGKWRNAKGTWARSRFFGEQAIRDHARVAVVEGPHDALRLRYHGIPTVAILGTQNWNKKKAKRLALLGVEELVILTDGDKPGRRCNREIREVGSDYFYTWSIKIPWGHDPGNITLGTINAIRRKLTSKGWFR